MAQKGDRAAVEPLALRMYAEGRSLADISRLLSVSDTTLRRWKLESQVPGEDLDGWDKSRLQRRGNIQRLNDLYERQLRYVEGLLPDDMTAPMMDTVSKLRALVDRENQSMAAETLGAAGADLPRVFLENMEFVANVLKEIDPEGLKILAKNFDAIVNRFKDLHAETA
jgi:hypothetical protein